MPAMVTIAQPGSVREFEHKPHLWPSRVRKAWRSIARWQVHGDTQLLGVYIFEDGTMVVQYEVRVDQRLFVANADYIRVERRLDAFAPGVSDHAMSSIIVDVTNEVI
jgi:hypothetical protein